MQVKNAEIRSDSAILTRHHFAIRLCFRARAFGIGENARLIRSLNKKRRSSHRGTVYDMGGLELRTE